ncbi:hypothetical protein HYW32_01470 [Candidatus Berkelbacteria bacterium]|nr:hypothetical protein [Candidatus Berkelbacteria bacterium]
MKRLVVGADRTQLRLTLFVNAKEYEELLVLEPEERSEEKLIAEFLARHSLTWQDLHQLGVLVVPHSRTSVRVTLALMQATGWVLDLPVELIHSAEITTFSPRTLWSRLKRRTKKRFSFLTLERMQ